MRFLRAVVAVLATTVMVMPTSAANAAPPAVTVSNVAAVSTPGVIMAAEASGGSYIKRCKQTSKQRKNEVLDEDFRYQTFRRGEATVRVCTKRVGGLTIARAWRISSPTKAVWGGWVKGHSRVIQDLEDTTDHFSGIFEKNRWFAPADPIVCPGRVCDLSLIIGIGVTNNIIDPVFPTNIEVG